MSQKKFARKATPINPLSPIKLSLRDAVESLGLQDAMEAGVELPDGDDNLFAFGVTRHCRWLEDNAKFGVARQEIIDAARLFRPYPCEVRTIIETLQLNAVVEAEPIQYAMAELILRSLAAMPQYRSGFKYLNRLLDAGREPAQLDSVEPPQQAGE